jgi:hypothetical protein
LGGRKYPREKYLFVAMIVSGVILFMYRDDAGSDENLDDEIYGKILVFMSLFMDGLSEFYIFFVGAKLLTN